MNQATEMKKLERAITTLAATISEIVRDRIQLIEQESKRRFAELPDRAADPILTKQELATKLRVGERTITDWMRRRKLPYMKLGYAVRFRWREVEQALQKLEIRARS